MGPVKKEQQAVWLPFIVLGYLETLRRATFYAFGWAGKGQALSIVSVIVVIYVFIDYFCPTRLRKFLAVTAGLLYIALVWVMNRTGTPGGGSWFREVIFGLPNFGTGSMTPFYYATFCFFVVFFYALIVFLVTGFVLEKKSVTEMFFAGILLLAVEIIASDEGILTPVALNIVFGIVLRGQVYLLAVGNDYRVRQAKGSGVNTNNWVGISLVLAVLFITLAMLLPTAKSKVDITSTSNRLVEQLASKRQAVSGGAKKPFELFWERMQDFELEGEVPTGNFPVMYVKSPKPTYWRGESADLYTGRGWHNSMPPRVAVSKEFDNPYSRSVMVDRVEQAFLLAPGMTSQVVFSSGAAASVEIPGGSLTVNDGGNLYTINTKGGLTYKVVSYIPERNPEKLKRTSTDYPLNIRKYYLQLPEKLPERVRKLADKLTHHADTPYEKVMIIQNFLSSNYPYDLAITTVPPNRDAVDYFLFDLKRGYCTYHSTAMVVMLRSIGIPARWVKGFVTGALNPEMGVYEVDISDAHAWVEVYFSDYGWLPFEPTPSFALPGEAHAGGGSPVPEANHTQSQPAGKVSPTEILNEDEPLFSWGTVITAMFLGSVGAAAYYLWRKKNIFKFGTGDRMRDIYLSFINLLAHKGYPKNAVQTPLEFAESLVDKFPDDYPDIIYITNAYLVDKYRKEGLRKTEVDRVKYIWKRLADKWLGKPRD